jgi:hypothetical protein
MMKKSSLLPALFILGLALNILAPALLQAQQSKIPELWQGGAKSPWPKLDWLEGTAKRLEKTKSLSQQSSEMETLTARAADLLEQARQTREDQFRSGRYLAATNALLDAVDRIYWSRKVDHTPQDQDFWGAGFVLQGCYFRVRQVDYFAGQKGVKNADLYITLSRSFYQQGRSAYDAREYHRARLIGEASSFIVFALECISQAANPDPHIYK